MYSYDFFTWRGLLGLKYFIIAFPIDDSFNNLNHSNLLTYFYVLIKLFDDNIKWKFNEILLFILLIHNTHILCTHKYIVVKIIFN